MRKLMFLAVVMFSLYGCNLYKNFKTPEVAVENLCGEDVEMTDSATIVPTWSQMFSDEQLRALIEKGISYNTDLRIARMNIEQSEALLLASKLAYVPSFALPLEGVVSKSIGSKAAFSYNLPLTMQWELDIFGKLRNQKEAARSTLFQSQEYVKMVQTQLIASIANSYYTLLMLDEQLRITEDWVKNQKENLEVIIEMKNAGMQTETAVNQATASYYDVQVSAKDIIRQIQSVELSIVLLVNEVPHAVTRNSFSDVDNLNLNINEVISLEVLKDRPDVKNAEYGLRKNFYEINVARAAFYPSISLGGSVGWVNNIGGMITNPGNLLFSAIASLTQPIFNKGVNSANLKIAKSKYEQSLLLFQKTLLVAGNEVNDALTSCQISEQKKGLRTNQVNANKLAYSNSMELMKHSSTTYLEVLIAQRALLQSKLNQVYDWFEGVQGKINLYKALGGGVE